MSHNKTQRVIVSFFLVICFVTNAFAEEVWTSYTVEDGLSYKWVKCIAIDNDGVKWFGTYGRGVSRFDGTDWQTYGTWNGLAGNDVRDITIDNDGVIWFGTYDGGVGRYDGNVWKTYTMDDGLVDNRVSAISVDDEGVMWFGTGNGVSSYDGEEWNTYEVRDYFSNVNYLIVNTIAIDNDNVKWFGTWYGIITLDDDGKWASPLNLHGPSSYYDQWIDTVCVDEEECKWIGGAGGVKYYDGNRWITYQESDGLIWNRVRCVAIDSKNVKWFGTDRGLSSFDGENWVSYTSTNGLVDDSVWGIAIDQNDVKWIGTHDGISRLGEPIDTGVESPAFDAPSTFTITPPYPNPFNPRTTIDYTVPQSGMVRLTVHDILGRTVATLVEKAQTPGPHSVVWDAQGQSSGIYVYRIEVDGELSGTGKMTLMK